MHCDLLWRESGGKRRTPDLSQRSAVLIDADQHHSTITGQNPRRGIQKLASAVHGNVRNSSIEQKHKRPACTRRKRSVRIDRITRNAAETTNSYVGDVQKLRRRIDHRHSGIESTAKRRSRNRRQTSVRTIDGECKNVKAIEVGRVEKPASWINPQTASAVRNRSPRKW